MLKMSVAIIPTSLMDILMLYDTSFETSMQSIVSYKLHNGLSHISPVVSTPFFIENQSYEVLIDMDRTI